MPARGDRIGALFVNPGGPGGTAADFAVTMGLLLPDEIVERFDIVGVDPRGLGASSIDRGGDMTELYGVDYSIDSPEDTAELLAVSQEYIDGCEAAAGDLLPAWEPSVARDIDAVRAAMGDDQLNYLGFSYGSAIGQMLAELFPDRVQAMIIDGIVDIEARHPRRSVASRRVRGRPAGLRRRLRRRFVVPRRSRRRRRHRRAAGGRRADPRPAPRPGARRAVHRAGLPLYSKDLWPDLSDAVADALDGDGTAMVSLTDQYIGVADFDVYFAAELPRLRVARDARRAAGRGREPRTSRPASPSPSSTTTCLRHVAGRGGAHARHRPRRPPSWSSRPPMTRHAVRGRRARAPSSSSRACCSPTRATATRWWATACRASTTSPRTT